MSFKTHLREILKTDSQPMPLPRMFLCALGVTIPLIVGAMNGNLSVSVYGALAGYLLALNDHMGTVGHRLWVITLTFLLILLGFSTGILVHDRPIAFELCLIASVYWLGILGGDGAEIERAVLFSVIGMIVASFRQSVSLTRIDEVFYYSLLAYLCVLIGIPVLKIGIKRKPEPFQRLTASIRKSFTKQKEKHIYAASYALTALSSIIFARCFHVERGYWIAITILLVMRADPAQSFYRTTQRLLGTAIGVLFCDLAAQVISTDATLIFGALICSFLIPWALKKNYLIASFLITVLIVFFLEFATGLYGDIRTPFIRLKATLIGCIFSLFGTAFSKTVSSILLRRR